MQEKVFLIPITVFILLSWSIAFTIAEQDLLRGMRVTTSSVRIRSVTIKNLKNVVSGTLAFENIRKSHGANVLGLYGQNGSGKTALIDAIELLQYTLRGKEIPQRYIHYINAGSDAITLLFAFVVQMPEKSINISYQFSLKAVVDTIDRNIDSPQLGEPKRRICVFDEILKCPIFGEGKSRMGMLIDTRGTEVFSPKPKLHLLVGRDNQIETDLQVAKKLASIQGRSFVFSRELLNTIRGHNEREDYDDEERSTYLYLIKRLVSYGNYELFVFNTSNSGGSSINAQPLAFAFTKESKGIMGVCFLLLDSPAVIPQQAKSIVEREIERINVVLREIIPTLTIGIKDLGTLALENGEIGSRIQLMSRRGSVEIPLNCESEGIKKIISILHLLIGVYNQSVVTVAIDSLDTGIFEYLLGELVKIISERGKGQLIFTSHNLRPLETLDRGNIAFTTANPNNRFVRMVGVKDSNNLRDVYYRNIMVGLQEEELYEQTNNAEIALACREAGEFSGP
ncbi:MAG TPA: AAA family ATPase [Sphaerochaeta sp.]|nr:AAA family ATPase [Sphaerochaeta sp.]